MQYHNEQTYKMGIDIGSTTVKVVLTDSANEIVFSRYRRHFSEIKKTVKEILAEAKEELGYCEFATMITGSGGVALANAVVVIGGNHLSCGKVYAGAESGGGRPFPEPSAKSHFFGGILSGAGVGVAVYGWVFAGYAPKTDKRAIKNVVPKATSP